ncbi:hypothetical protein MFLAVUS_000594 [Mucor flavus]|uniref:Uncharacterized protein n=1 Tax=Mucor flavus TaxID=439312 RepID=A0ABP9YK46_9FUNG
MIEIDILKASAHHTKPSPPSNYNNDDTDISEPDTALNTPTGSLTDSLSRRYSYTCYKNYPQRKPSFTPKTTDFDSQQQTTDILEKRIQALEEDINQHVKREADLQSQVFLLTEKQQGVQYKSTLSRISKQIDQFLVNHEEGVKSTKSSGYWTQDWSGNEISQLYGYQDLPKEPEPTDTSITQTNIPILLIYRLKSMMENFTLKDHKDPTVQSFSNQVYGTLDSWQVFYHKKLMLEKQNKIHEQNRITRLLQALQKTILKNKLMKQDYNILIKKYTSDIDQLVHQINLNPSLDEKQQNEPVIQKRKELQLVEQEDNTKSTTFIRNVLESQIRTLEKDLSKCQDERDEYESTLEMVRREMETMLEELEDTRQQRLRYKTQASRLRAGLEAIQKRHQSDESETSNDESEDEGKEAIRLMYNEAERQAIDLDRECKRQALTLSGIRQELKTSQEKYQTIQTEKDTELKILQRTNQRLNRDIEMLRVEKHELVTLQQQNYQSAGQSKISAAEEEMDEHYYLAKIYALQTNLKASQCDAVMQRTKISQLERQATLVDISDSFVAGLQDLFQQETSVSDEPNLREMADIIESEQTLWKYQCTKTFQKRYDIDLLTVNRELRFLSCKLNDVEDEMNVLKARHLEELSLLKYQTNAEFQNKLQRITSTYRLREQKLQSQLETLFQKNQTLKDESVILYGRNMLMAHQLGKIAP